MTRKDNPALFSRESRKRIFLSKHLDSADDFQIASAIGMLDSAEDDGTFEVWKHAMLHSWEHAPRSILFFDFETNTLNGYGVSLGMVMSTMERGVLTSQEKKYLLINPLAPLDPEAQKVHGISMEDLAGAPTFSDLYHSGEIEWLFQADMLVAYNALYDMGVLINELQRLGIPFPDNLRFLDMMSRIKHVVQAKGKSGRKKDAKLSEAAERFSVTYSQSDLHNALEDTILLQRVFEGAMGEL